MKSLKEYFAKIFWAAFLKIAGMSADEYWTKVYWQEKQYRRENGLEL